MISCIFSPWDHLISKISPWCNQPWLGGLKGDMNIIKLNIGILWDFPAIHVWLKVTSVWIRDFMIVFHSRIAAKSHFGGIIPFVGEHYYPNFAYRIIHEESINPFLILPFNNPLKDTQNQENRQSIYHVIFMYNVLHFTINKYTIHSQLPMGFIIIPMEGINLDKFHHDLTVLPHWNHG